MSVECLAVTQDRQWSVHEGPYGLWIVLQSFVYSFLARRIKEVVKSLSLPFATILRT